MNNRDQELLGLLGGGLSAAAVHYNRTQDNLDRRIDRVDDRSRDALDLINRWLNSGANARLLMAAVQDVIAGVAMSSPAPQAPAVVPATTVVTRPDLSGFQSATGNNWPPMVGTYDADSRILTIGELTKFGLALTYEEVRTALLAWVLPTAPTLGNKAQIFYVLNALLHSVATRGLTWEQYKAAWDVLFQNPAQLQNPHRDSQRPPTVYGFGNQVDSVVVLPGSTDEVTRLLLTAKSGGAGIVAGTNVVTVRYGSEYRALVGSSVQPLAPFVIAQPLADYEYIPVTPSAQGYSLLQNSGTIAAGDSLELRVMSMPGIAPA